jgi:hypothetical protein
MRQRVPASSTPSQPSAARMPGVRQMRLVAGLVLFTYVTLHFANHALGNISVEAMENGLKIQKWIWQSIPGTIVLYSALTIHMALGFPHAGVLHDILGIGPIAGKPAGEPIGVVEMGKHHLIETPSRRVTRHESHPSFMLSYKGSPLAAIAYVDAEGSPVMLCIIANEAPDAPMRLEQRGELSLASWSRGGRGYLVIGRIPEERAVAFAETLEKRI